MNLKLLNGPLLASWKWIHIWIWKRLSPPRWRGRKACSPTEKSTCRQCVCVEHHLIRKATLVATNNIAKAVSIQFENMLSWCWETNYLNYLWWANESENQQTKHTPCYARASKSNMNNRKTSEKNKMQIHWDRDRMRKRKAATACFWF